MTPLQKGIKIGAIVLAIFIIATIFQALTQVIYLVYDKSVTKDSINFSKEYKDIQEIELDLKAYNVNVYSGDKFLVTSTNKKKFTINSINKKLVIKEYGKWFNKGSKNQTISIMVPKHISLQELDIEADIGNLNIKNIIAEKLDLDMNIGKLTINNSSFAKTDLDGGAGEINIYNSKLNNLDLDAGVGNINISSYISGDSKIDCSVGNIDLELLGSKHEYTLILNKGIGNIKVNNEKQSKKTIYGTGNKKLEINGAVGNTNINFK